MVVKAGPRALHRVYAVLAEHQEHQAALVVVVVVSREEAGSGGVCEGHDAIHGLVIPNPKVQLDLPLQKTRLSLRDLDGQRRRDVTGLAVQGWQRSPRRELID